MMCDKCVQLNLLPYQDYGVCDFLVTLEKYNYLGAIFLSNASVMDVLVKIYIVRIHNQIVMVLKLNCKTAHFVICNILKYSLKKAKWGPFYLYYLCIPIRLFFHQLYLCNRTKILSYFSHAGSSFAHFQVVSATAKEQKHFLGCYKNIYEYTLFKLSLKIYLIVSPTLRTCHILNLVYL